MDKLDLIASILDKAKQKGATEADAIIVDSSSLNTEVRLGKLVSSERSENIAIALRVLIDKKQAMISSSNLQRDSLDEIVERAISMAKVTPPNPDLRIASSDEYAKEILDLDLYDVYEPGVDILIETAKGAEDAAFSNKLISNSEGSSAFYATNSIYFATSNGFLHQYNTSTSGFSLEVIAGEGENMQTGSSYSIARYSDDLKSPQTVGKEAAAKAIRKLNPQKFSTEQLPVIFDYRVARGILGAFASAINGSNLSKGTSFLCDSLNKNIFNENISIIDDPFIIRGLSSRPFDAEAIKGSKLNLVEGGMLKHYLLDIQTANKLKMQTNGHATRGLSSAPQPSSSNLYLLAGKTKLDDMIKSLKKGLIITEVFGHGANIVTGDYSQGAAGLYIENGEVVYPVNEITIAGNLVNMFKSMIPADDLKFEASVNTPSLLFENLTIGGK